MVSAGYMEHKDPSPGGNKEKCMKEKESGFSRCTAPHHTTQLHLTSPRGQLNNYPSKMVRNGRSC